MRSFVPVVLLAALTSVSVSVSVALPASAATPALASSATAAVAASGGAAGTDITVTLPEGRSYLLFRPAKPAARPGLVVSLHHRGGTAASTEKATNLDLGAGSSGAFVAYPESGAGSWNAGTCCSPAVTSGTDDVSFLDHVLDDALARTGVTEGRVAMAGYSNGGMMSYRYSCERPSRVPLIVVDAATSVSPCSRTAPVSVIAVHGALDTTVPWLGASALTGLLGINLPSVASTLGGVAALDHCAGGFTQDVIAHGVDRWVAQGCPSGITVAVLRSPTLAHYWPTGATDLAAYGIDTSALLWSMVNGRWATT